MFNKCDFITMKLNDGATYLGLVRYNDVILGREFSRPFLRDDSVKQISKIIMRDYNKTDQFIVAALNDYYKRISVVQEAERAVMLQNYNRLYQSWTLLNQAKASKNMEVMEQQYDSLSYQLYLLGYKMSNY